MASQQEKWPNSNAAQNVVYSPPDPVVLETFARRVCQRLGAEYLAPDTVQGLATFVTVAATIQAKQLTQNTRGQVDNDS